MIELFILAGMIIQVMMSGIELNKRIQELISKIDESVGEVAGVKTLEDVIKIIDSLEYRTEILDSTKPPIATLREGGDCEDIAVLAASLLKYIGLNPGIAIAYNEDDPEAHAFAFIKNDNEYTIFSNNNVFTAKDIMEASEMLGYFNVIYNVINQTNKKEVERWVT